MSYAAAIRDYMFEIPINKIVSTREVLHLGTRCAVDQTLFRMVKNGELIRVAWGLFVRAGSDIPSAMAIVEAKAAAFGRSVVSHGSSVLEYFGLIDNQDLPPTFGIGGGSSSFLSKYGRNNFVGTCDRKRHLVETIEGQTIRAFWHLGQDTFESLYQDLFGHLTDYEQSKVARQAAWMPAWMSDKFIER